MLQLKHGGGDRSVRVAGTLPALAALSEAGYLARDDYEHFSAGYRFQRSVEARIRLMESASRHDLPTDEKELSKLAYLLDWPDPNGLVAEAERIFAENRRRFDAQVDRETA